MGFKIVRQSGSHIHLWNDQRRILVTVPNHKELAKGTLNGIIKQSKKDRNEFLSHIK
jgi:predicted RNA binding protein YcfA (HicA-like mRNA interferase family)